MALSAYDLLWEISQHEIGNIDEIFTTKDLKNRFKKMSFDELDIFLRSCDSMITDIKNNPCIDDDAKKPLLQGVLILSKLAQPIAKKKLKEKL